MGAAAIRRGETVEHLTLEQVHATPPRCEEHRTPAAQEVAQAGGQMLPGFDTIAPRPTEPRYPR